MRQRPAIATLALLVALGCTHGTIGPATSHVVPQKERSVSAVSVTLDAAVEAERRAAYEELGGNEAIAREVESTLREHGHFDPAASARLEVTITNFRLRSAGNAFVNGFFAGVDMMDGEVRVVPASGEPARYTFKLSGSEEVYFKIGRGARFRSLAQALGRRVNEVFQS